MISRSSVAGQRLDKAQVGGSFPPVGTSFQLGVAQMAARVIWDHEAAGSKPATETRQRALGCGRSSMAEPRAVNPLVPVRLRPVTPKRMRSSMRRELERQSTGLLPRMVRVRAPGDAPHNNPLVAE